MTALTAIASFPDHFASKFVVKPDTGCWIWTGWRNSGGYGMFTRAKGEKPITAHRFAYETVNGPVPHKLEADHLCRVKECVNPWHLEMVTHQENVLRGTGVSAHNARKTHCPYGHPLDGLLGSGWRYCLTCNRLRARKNRGA